MRLVLVGALVAGGAVLAPPQAGGQDPGGCTQPYAPVAFAHAYPAQEQLPTIDAAEVPQEDVVRSGIVPFDSDGDGTDDVVSSLPGGGVRVTRGDGVVDLTAAGALNLGANGASGLGDLDGDGRDEFQVLAYDAPGPDEGTFLVPGTVATGTQALSDAGISFLPAGGLLVDPGDGSGRLLWTTSATTNLDPSTAVFDTAAVMALAPGSTTSGLTPSPVLDGELATVADLGDPEAALVTVDLLSDGSGENRSATVTLVRAGVVTRFTTEPELYLPNDPGIGGVTVLDGPGGTFLRLMQTSRSGSGHYLWSLTDPCTALAAEELPAAPPAAPVDAEARFTG